MVEAVSIHAVTVFEVADDRLDGRAALYLPFDGRRDPSLLFGREDAQFIDAGRIVASVTGVGEDAFQGGAGQLLDLGDLTATARLSCNKAVRRSSPMRCRQRVRDERSRGRWWQKNSSPQKYW